MDYRRIVQDVVGPDWQISRSDPWYVVTPPCHVPRRQGWKLHLSATPAAAPTVLENAAKVLAAHDCAFKFAGTPKIAADLVSVRIDRGRSGKFLTLYPSDDDQCRLLAEQLHDATAGLPGPAILSDRRYRPGSLVHYRYGCFTAPRELTDEGSYEARLLTPDGTLVADERNPWFSPPEWAVDPFGALPRRAGITPLLAHRYRVVEAIQHSNRGGVYRARDEQFGNEVVLKEARPHVGFDSTGGDAQDWLRHEAAVLDALAPLGIVPRKLELVEWAGHLFLAEELIEGTSLQSWFAERRKVDANEAWQLARDLAAVIAKVHEAGFVLRDLKPSNVMVPSDGPPKLIDLECAVRQGESIPVVGTEGFTAPEYLHGADGTAVESIVDSFSLGVTLLHATTGFNSALLYDSEPVSDRVAAIVRAASADNPALRALAPVVLGLTAAESTRWSVDQAVEFLRAEPSRGTDFAPPQLDSPQLLRDGLTYLVNEMTPAEEYLWPRPSKLPASDPCNVQTGAGGVLAVLDRAVRVGEHSVLPALRTAADWIDHRLDTRTRVLPGLYFGRSGAAWALYEAARTLDDPALADRALSYALRIPIEWHNADICHGIAGAGIAQLHLWRRTGDDRFAVRALAAADALLRLSASAKVGVEWKAGRDDLSGMGTYGFAHGVAGAGAFLLAAGRELNNAELVDIAIGGGEALCAVAEHDDGAAGWPKGPRSTDRPGLNFWCNGTSGVGTFLVRLWETTGDPRFLDHAEQAGLAVYRDRWRLAPGTCHGLAGNAELLLDLAAVTGRPRYRTWAAEMAHCLLLRAARRDGLLLVPDDTLLDVCPSYNVGLAGVLDFLLRLRHGGARSWLVDPPSFQWKEVNDHGE